MFLDCHLLIIDPQNDFCDLPLQYCPVPTQGTQALLPALPVAGAHADMLRLAALVNTGGEGLSRITITLDSHQHLDIAHPAFWLTESGETVTPFTQITAQDLRTGKFVPRNGDGLVRCQRYLDALEAGGRYTHMVWPTHCELGSWGHNIHADLHLACRHWEDRTAVNVGKVLKGMNPWTEHFSAVAAEVPDPEDPATQINHDLIALLRQSDRIYIAGEAGSHCVKATSEHIAEQFPADELHKLVLIEDCMSAVTGFESQAQDFLATMSAKGVRIASSAEVTAELKANIH